MSHYGEQKWIYIYIHTYREYDPAKMSILPGNYNDMIQAILNAGGLLFQDVKAA
jgi:hypothetical protein